MFTTIEQFAASWSNEAASTQKVMDALTDASLNQKIAPDYRSLGQIAWHLVVTVHEMLSRTGLEFEPIAEDELAPASAAVIADAYRRVGQAMLKAVQTQWSDKQLLETSEMYGEHWPNGLTLHIFIQHEVHHRGQMTVLMRQAGLKVPDFYGPTRDSWIEQGMQPMV